METRGTTGEETISYWFDLPIDVAEFEEKLGIGAESGDYRIIEKVLPYADEVHEHTSVYQLNELDFMYRQLSSDMQEEYVSLLTVYENLEALYICRNVITVYPDCKSMIDVARQKLMNDPTFKHLSEDCQEYYFDFEAYASHLQEHGKFLVGGLVQVHEVHVDGLPRDFLVVLGGQLQQRLGQHFEAANPHLGRGEGVAPGDDADDVRVGGSLDHELLDTVGGLQGGLEDDLGRNLAGVVQVVDHFSGVNGDLAQGFFAVQVLRTNAEPDFLALEGVFHNHRVTSFTSLFMGVCLSFIRRPRLPSERGAKTPPCWRSQR